MGVIRVIRALLVAGGLLVILLLAAAVVGLAGAILAVMVMQAVEEEHQVPAPVPARRPVQTPALLIAPTNPAMGITRMEAQDGPAIPVTETSPVLIRVMGDHHRVSRRSKPAAVAQHL